MSSITLSIRKETLDVSINHGIVARIHGYPATSKDPDQLYFKEVTIPATNDGGLTVDVDPGRYRIQAILPSGAMLQEERHINEGETASVTFSAGPAQRDWLSWQQFDGSLRTRPASTGPTAGEGTSDGRIILGGSIRRVLRGPWVRRSIAKVPGLRDLLKSVISAEALEMFPETWRGVRNEATLAFRQQSSLREGHGPQSWSTIASAAQAVDVARLWSPETERGLRVDRVQQDGNLSLWRCEFSRNTDFSTRFWAFSDVADVVEICSIPLPWSGVNEPASVDVLVDSTDGNVGVHSSIIVRDAVLGGLLAYLGRGRLSNARPLVDSLESENLIENTIQGKVQNPLAACAAAYVGLSMFDPGEAERWDSWLPNIMYWFPHIPDGAILHARRMLLRPGSAAETEAVLNALKEAYRRGIPYFTAGVLGLRDSLLMFRDKDSEVKQMLQNVSSVATRLDIGQAFTVLTFPKM